MPPRKKGEKNSSKMATSGAASTASNSASTAVGKVNPVTCVKNVLKEGKIDPNQEARNKAILEAFLKNLIRVMKEEDKLFGSVFQRPYYTGSYYENLRISDPNEFDINLVLNLPFKPEVREIEYIKDVKSFVAYKLKKTKQNNDVLLKNEDLLRVLFEREYLIPSKVRSWVQGVVDRALNSVHPPQGVIKIIPRASGPAKTIVLKTSFGYDIDIDLVPAIQFSYPEWPKGARTDMLHTFKVGDMDRFWFLVPKDFSAEGTGVNMIDSKCLWRIHFPEIEKKIILNRGCVKPVIKLLKALRNKEDWKILASYYLKTVVLWLVERHPSPDYWKEDNIYYRLLEVLEALKVSVGAKVIKYYFYPDFNLIQKIPSPQAVIIVNRLDKIIKDIKTNPQKIEIYFKF